MSSRRREQARKYETERERVLPFENDFVSSGKIADEDEKVTEQDQEFQDLKASIQRGLRVSELASQEIGSNPHHLNVRGVRASYHPIFLSYHKNITYITLLYHKKISRTPAL